MPRPEDEETLRRLEERLDRASRAAERLFEEATGHEQGATSDGAGSRREPPPSGWQAPAGEATPDGHGEFELLLQVAHSLRDLIPPELQRRLSEALRELLLALRALIDWYLERSERPPSGPADVQDIPIL
jgi:hypothetical protein